MTRTTLFLIASAIVAAASASPAMADRETYTQHMVPSPSIDGAGPIDWFREADASPRLNINPGAIR